MKLVHVPALTMTDFATSTAPADVVRRQYLASATGDLAGFALASTYGTRDGVTSNVMEQLGQDWDGWSAHDDTYVIDGENVVVLARYTTTNKATGKAIDVRDAMTV